MNFPEKKPLSVFKYSNYLPSCQKSQKTNEPFLRKIPNGQTNRGTGNGDFIGPSIGRLILEAKSDDDPLSGFSNISYTMYNNV